MQDFDDPSQPTHNPNGVARYQTHLTAGRRHQKAPLANESVKLWADQANTIVLVNGQSYTIGPDDDTIRQRENRRRRLSWSSSAATPRPTAATSDMSRAAAARLGVVHGSLRAHAGLPRPRVPQPRGDRPRHRPGPGRCRRSRRAPTCRPPRRTGDSRTRANTSTPAVHRLSRKQHNQPQQVASAIQKMTGSVGTAPPSGSKTLKAPLACAPPTPRASTSPTPTRPARSIRR